VREVAVEEETQVESMDLAVIESEVRVAHPEIKQGLFFEMVITFYEGSKRYPP
jgi:hypothetical protein